MVTLGLASLFCSLKKKTEKTENVAYYFSHMYSYCSVVASRTNNAYNKLFIYNYRTTTHVNKFIYHMYYEYMHTLSLCTHISSMTVCYWHDAKIKASGLVVLTQRNENKNVNCKASEQSEFKHKYISYVSKWTYRAI